MPPCFTCRFCSKSFERNFCLKRHLKNMHSITENIVKGNFSCPICSANVTEFMDFVNHSLICHDITIKSETLTFLNENDFEIWKKETEKSSKTHFVKHRSDREKSQGPVWKVSQLHCSRSGIFRPKPSEGKRKREVKIQGSRKINGYCPCGIKVSYFIEGKIEVFYCSTHIGHKPDLAHVPLTLEERVDVATTMARKIPFETILDNVRSTVKGQDLDRIHFLTKQDLYNIGSEFGLNNNTERHPNVPNVKSTECSPGSPEDENGDVDEVVIGGSQIDINLDSAEKMAVLEEVGTKEDNPIEEEKLELVESFKKIVSKIKSCEELKICKQVLKSLESKIKANVNSATLPAVKPGRNKNIEQQRCFLSLKKRNRLKVSKKPTSEEAEKIALEAVLDPCTMAKPSSSGCSNMNLPLSEGLEPKEQ